MGSEMCIRDRDKAKDDEQSAEDKKDGDEKKDDKAVQIDFDNIAARIIDAPGLPAGNYTGLERAPSGKVFVLETVEGSRGATSP